MLLSSLFFLSCNGKHFFGLILAAISFQVIIIAPPSVVMTTFFVNFCPFQMAKCLQFTLFKFYRIIDIIKKSVTFCKPIYPLVSLHTCTVLTCIYFDTEDISHHQKKPVWIHKISLKLVYSQQNYSEKKTILVENPVWRSRKKVQIRTGNDWMNRQDIHCTE